jgi:hypothetical protein
VTHATVATQLVQDAAGVRYAYRHFGAQSATATTLGARDTQYDAIVEWGDPRPRRAATAERDPLADADHPRRARPDHPGEPELPDGGPDLGSADRIYRDAAHAFLFQEPAEVAGDVNAFLAV